MSKSLKILTAMSIHAAASVLEGKGYFDENNTKELNKHQRMQSESKFREKQGIKEFKYSNEVIYARNKKNADRKARNKGLI